MGAWRKGGWGPGRWRSPKFRSFFCPSLAPMFALFFFLSLGLRRDPQTCTFGEGPVEGGSGGGNEKKIKKMKSSCNDI